MMLFVATDGIGPFSMLQKCLVGRADTYHKQTELSEAAHQLVEPYFYLLSVKVVCYPALRVDLVLNWQDKVGSTRWDVRLANGLFQPQLGINYQL